LTEQKGAVHLTTSNTLPIITLSYLWMRQGFRVLERPLCSSTATQHACTAAKYWQYMVRNDQVKSQLLDNVCCLQDQPGNWNLLACTSTFWG